MCVWVVIDDSSQPAGSAAAHREVEVLLTPTGAVVVGMEAANASAKTHRARISSDQRVSDIVVGCWLLLLLVVMARAV